MIHAVFQVMVIPNGIRSDPIPGETETSSLFLLRLGLRGGVGDFDVRELFLADGADCVGICVHERSDSQRVVQVKTV